MPRPKNPYKPFKPYVFFDEDGTEHLVDHPIMQPPLSVRKNRGWQKQEAQRIRVMEILRRIEKDHCQNIKHGWHKGSRHYKTHYLKNGSTFAKHVQTEWSDLINVEADDSKLRKLFKWIKQGFSRYM